jgi:hypothetical protein
MSPSSINVVVFVDTEGYLVNELIGMIKVNDNHRIDSGELRIISAEVGEIQDAVKKELDHVETDFPCKAIILRAVVPPKNEQTALIGIQAELMNASEQEGAFVFSLMPIHIGRSEKYTDVKDFVVNTMVSRIENAVTLHSVSSHQSVDVAYTCLCNWLEFGTDSPEEEEAKKEEEDGDDEEGDEDVMDEDDNDDDDDDKPSEDDEEDDDSNA